MTTDDASQSIEYLTRGNITVRRTAEPVPPDTAIDPLIDELDDTRGMLLSSTFEFPDRYSRWDLAFASPPLAVSAVDRTFRIEALVSKGAPLLAAIKRALERDPAVRSLEDEGAALSGRVATSNAVVPEERRSREPTIFSVLRSIIGLFASDSDRHLGLYGTFGYDLVLQFEPITLRHQRDPRQRDLVLYLPDDITVVDHRRETAFRYRYEFAVPGEATAVPPRDTVRLRDPTRRTGDAPGTCETPVRESDHTPGEFAATVRAAHEAFRRGDLFEVTPSQTFARKMRASPSDIFRRLRSQNPAPYGFFANLGDGEYLLGASPEMYVRVTGDRVETCPIAGTIARGKDTLGDADQILRLLASSKDEAELTMCTDVDRNDKSRVCRAGTVQVLGRRQIEAYSRLFHTVDHIEGRLREDCDALDAFLSHTWAVTVTGAPKPAALQFIENAEKGPRAWYAGAVGVLSFDGSANTGLTLRAVHLRDGIARVRAGATLLFDSDPDEEERESRLKASALLDVLDSLGEAARAQPHTVSIPGASKHRPGVERRILLVDHRDSFVHTLADYFRQTGAHVTTLRAGFPEAELDALSPDLVVLSPGPGSPREFALATTIDRTLKRKIPCFGVCLGLQGMVEYFGGTLGQLATPVHGRASFVRVLPRELAPDGKGNARRDWFEGLPTRFRAGRYHSLFARRDCMPRCLRVRAETDDNVVMAIEHETLPLAAVQFHPESVMSVGERFGIRLIENVVDTLLPDRSTPP